MIDSHSSSYDHSGNKCKFDSFYSGVNNRDNLSIFKYIFTNVSIYNLNYFYFAYIVIKNSNIFGQIDFSLSCHHKWKVNEQIKIIITFYS